MIWDQFEQAWRHPDPWVVFGLLVLFSFGAVVAVDVKLRDDACYEACGFRRHELIDRRCLCAHNGGQWLPPVEP